MGGDNAAGNGKTEAGPPRSALVVKKGSKILRHLQGDMPGPESVIVMFSIPSPRQFPGKGAPLVMESSGIGDDDQENLLQFPCLP